MSTVQSIGSASKTYDSTTLRRSAQTPAEAPKSSANPKDEWIPSGAAPKDEPKTEAGEAQGNDASEAAKWRSFDMAQFRSEMNAKLLEQIGSAKKALSEAGVAMYGGTGKLYELPEGQEVEYSDEVMGVGKDWGAEATSQRIVDFALAFRGKGTAKGLSDEEFFAKIRDAIEAGFGSAKDDMGDLPGPTAKLFNDTYKATMDKLDKAFETLKAGASAGADPTASAVATNTAKASASSTGSSLSILA